jgi:large subunit ribosomal protein L22
MNRYTASLERVRMSHFKLRQVARVLRGKTASDGRGMLQFIPRKSARLIGGVLRDAIANAENNCNALVEDLRIENVLIEKQAPLRRHIPAARGSSHPIRKGVSRIRVVLVGK